MKRTPGSFRGIQAQKVTPVWIALGEQGAVERVVVDTRNECPSITIDGRARGMTMRLPIPAGLHPASEYPVLALWIGSTDCRVKGIKAPQDVTIPRSGRAEAESKPDLVVSVGDYLYREEPCPPGARDSCGGIAGMRGFQAKMPASSVIRL